MKPIIVIALCVAVGACSSGGLPHNTDPHSEQSILERSWSYNCSKAREEYINYAMNFESTYHRNRFEKSGDWFADTCAEYTPRLAEYAQTEKCRSVIMDQTRDLALFRQKMERLQYYARTNNENGFSGTVAALSDQKTEYDRRFNGACL